MAAIFGGFSKIFCQKLQRLQICLDTPVTVLDRAICIEIALSRTVKEYRSKCSVLPFLAKKFRKSPKMAAIFGDFRKFLPKIAKHRFASISLDTLCEIERFCRNRSISTRLQEIEANLQSLPFLAKYFRKSPKMAAIFGEGKIFAKNCKYYKFP